MIKVYDAVNDGVKDIFSFASWNSIVHIVGLVTLKVTKGQLRKLA